MLSLLPTAQHYDSLILLTHHFTQTGISEIAPGTITPASKLWLDFSYQPIAYILQVLSTEDAVGKDTKEEVKNVPDVLCPTSAPPTIPVTDDGDDEPPAASPIGNEIDPTAPPLHSTVKSYRAHKAQHPECVIFLHVGDFYETFDDDARTVADELNLFLTGKGEGPTRSPMTGIPAHAFERYQTLLNVKGFTVLALDTDHASVTRTEATMPRSQSQKMQNFEILAGSIPIAVSYDPRWLNSIDTVHFEFESKELPRQPIPCSPTGYHSHFTTPDAVAEYGTPHAYAKAYVELNRIKAFKPTKSKTDKENPEIDEQMALTLDCNPTASDEPETDPEIQAALQASLDALCPLSLGEVVEISESLHPKHAARNAVGQWGKITKLDRDFETATIELIDDGKRYTIPILYLERVKLPEVTYLGKSKTVGYTTINGQLHGWLGFKTKTLYKEWCCRARTHNARLKGIGDPKRSTHLLEHKWECEVQKPTMKKLKALAEHDLTHNPPPVYTKRRLPKSPPDIRPILEPGTLVEVITKDENGSSKSTGQVGTVIVDYLKDGIVDGIVVKLGKNRDEYLTNGEFRVVDTEPQLENTPLVDNSPQPLAA